MPSLIGKIEPGDVIGRCRIIRELGRGGVGTVYLATHQTLQIEVALKILSPSLSLDNPALAERFIREAQLAARIRHPNVIAVMDAAQDEATGLYFIVLEYVGGGSLSWHLRHGPLPEAKALGIITGITHALVLAQENRIVHRDIKPDNIMLDLRGTAKLADLGLAKHDIDSRTSLTLGGSYMGTPAYMSPEQARDAKAADTRDDIYSLGATFYECLTGEPPFQGETPYNIMSELLTKPSPQPRLQRPDVSRSVDLICRKMMAKTRSLRYADPDALLKDLQHCQLFGDSGLDKLEAATFNKDSIQARHEALNYGVETSADGVALVPEPPEDSEIGAINQPTPVLIAPRRADYGVFGAAALLVVLVTMATLLLAWLGPHHRLSFLKNGFAWVPAHPSSQQAALVPAKLPADQGSHPAEPENPPPDPAPKIPSDVAAIPSTPPVAPVVNPVNPADVPNVTPAVPVDAETPPGPAPAVPVAPASAFEARNIAESSLGTIDADPTGQPELLRIIGKRDNSPEVAPTAWTFYFYDSKAMSNARIITVKNGKVVKNGEDLLHPLVPFGQDNVIPNDKLLVDSRQALQIAQTLVPGITISGSQLEVTQKNSVPAWKMTLWARNQEGEEQELGNVTILAENGAVSSNTLKPDRLARH